MATWKLENEHSPPIRDLLIRLDEEKGIQQIEIAKEISVSGSPPALAYLLQKFNQEVVNSRFGTDGNLENGSDFLVKIARELIFNPCFPNAKDLPNTYVTALESMKFLGTAEDLLPITTCLENNVGQDLWEYGIEAILFISEASASTAGLMFFCKQLDKVSESNDLLSTKLISGIGSFEEEAAKSYLEKYFRNEAISKINRSSALYSLLDGFGEDENILNLGLDWLMEKEREKRNYPIYGMIKNKCEMLQMGMS